MAGLDAMVAEGMVSDRMEAIRRCIQLGILTSRTDRGAAIVRWSDLMEMERAESQAVG